MQSQYVPIFGETDLPPEQFEPIRELAKSALLTSAPGLRQQIGMLYMNEDRSSAHYFWALMHRREDPEYFAEWVQKASKEALYDFVVDSTKHLDPIATDVMKFEGPAAIIHPQPRFMEFVPPLHLPDSRVTVLGDAAHAMIPLRGAGLNTALLDACDLGKLLGRARDQGDDPSSVVKAYLAAMLPRGREAVLASRAAGNADVDDPVAFFKQFQR